MDNPSDQATGAETPRSAKQFEHKLLILLTLSTPARFATYLDLRSNPRDEGILRVQGFEVGGTNSCGVTTKTVMNCSFLG